MGSSHVGKGESSSPRHSTNRSLLPQLFPFEVYGKEKVTLVARRNPRVEAGREVLVVKRFRSGCKQHRIGADLAYPSSAPSSKYQNA